MKASSTTSNAVSMARSARGGDEPAGGIVRIDDDDDVGPCRAAARSGTTATS